VCTCLTRTGTPAAPRRSRRGCWPCTRACGRCRVRADGNTPRSEPRWPAPTSPQRKGHPPRRLPLRAAPRALPLAVAEDPDLRRSASRGSSSRSRVWIPPPGRRCLKTRITLGGSRGPPSPLRQAAAWRGLGSRHLRRLPGALPPVYQETRRRALLAQVNCRATRGPWRRISSLSPSPMPSTLSIAARKLRRPPAGA